jgi:hypothetical protein
VEERRGVGRGGRGWGSRKGRGGREGLKEREGKRRKWRREGERNLDPPMFQTDRRHCIERSVIALHVFA